MSTIGPLAARAWRGAFGVTALVAVIESAVLWGHRPRRSNLDHGLATANRRLSFAWNAARLGMFELTSRRGALWANPQFSSLIGVDQSTPLTLERVVAAVHIDDRQTLESAIASALSSREPVPCEVRTVDGNREPRWLALTLISGAESGGLEGTLSGLAVEITDRRKMESELLRQRQQLAHLARVSLLGELAGALAHELSQPLTSILSNAEAGQHYLEEKSLDLGEVREILNDIVSDDRRAGDVIRRLRALLTRGETRFQRVEVQQLIDDVLAVENGELVARNVRLRVNIPDGMPAVRADRIELQQVLLNLVLNACEAMSMNSPHERVIDVSASVAEGGEQVRVSVGDRGRGIAPELMERIFDPFFTTKRDGMGIGLAICSTIIAAHSGRMWATGTPERGAALHFTVPVFREERHAQAESTRH